MDDLFTENQKGRIAVQLATDSLVIIYIAYNGLGIGDAAPYRS